MIVDSFSKTQHLLSVSLKRASLVIILLVSPLIALASGEYPAVNRIVAVGDIHGDYDNFKKVLTQAGLINRRGNWIAGDTHFVQLGDLPDRGPDTDKIIEHMRKLELQAVDDGGQVHALIGNHEAMNIYGDLRYVHAGEYAAFRTSRSRDFRDRYYDSEVSRMSALDEDFVADRAFKDQWMDRYPLGYVEHRLAWSPTGSIGSWVVENNAIVKIGRVLFLHGGVSAKLLDLTVTQINDQVRTELKGNLPEEPGLSEAEDGPLWYRGLASADEQLEAAHLDTALATFDVDRIVIAHTPGMGTIVPRFSGKVLIIDTGIADYYGGHVASLLVESNEFYTVQEGESTRLPNSEKEMLPYFEKMSTLIQGTPALESKLESLRGL